MKILLFFILSILSCHSYAFVCKTNDGVEVMGGTQNIYDVPIDSDIFAQPDRINEFADIDEFMTCRNEAPLSYVDYLRLTGARAGTKFTNISGLKTGVVLNGNYLLVPFSGQDYPVFALRVATQPLPIKLYLQVSTKPTNAVLIRKGDLLMTLYLHKYATWSIGGDPFDHYDFEWNFYAADDVIVGTGTCDINNNQIIEIDFGQINPSGISTVGASSRYQINKDLIYHCDDNNLTMPIKMYFTAEPAGFSNNAMLVRTGSAYGSGSVMPGMGVEMYHENKVVSPLNGNFISEIKNGYGQDTVTFTVVKKENIMPGDLIEGMFNASGTIVMSTP
ncbi:fimbrial protein [Providencia manganoxydans]|uniref:fimbrial protein n=1 Tax=Providencia manganoxydans TaxID=2923283 RepID=UPI0034DDBA13